MRICFFTENYYKGGLDTFLINLINAWPDDEDELTLVCNSSHSGLDNIASMTKRTLVVIKYNRFFTSLLAQGQVKSKFSWTFLIRLFIGWSYRFLEYPVIFPWYVFSQAFFFKSSKFDRLMVVNGGYPASLLGRSAIIGWWLAGKRPLATMNFHSLATCTQGRFKLFDNIIDRLIVKLSNRLIGVSKACLNSLSSRDAFLGCTKLSYIYNGIEDPVDLLGLNSYVHKYESAKPYCLMLATYHSYKGHFYLLEAFKMVLEEYPDLRLQIHGHSFGNEKKQVADEVIRLGLEKNVTLNDFTSNTAELIAGANILVVPSQAYESFGLTIIEAMAFSVPVITTNVGGMPEVLEGSNAGYVCSKDEPQEFAAAIKNVMGNPIMASNLGLNGRLAFEDRYIASRMANQYNKLLKK